MVFINYVVLLGGIYSQLVDKNAECIMFGLRTLTMTTLLQVAEGAKLRLMETIFGTVKWPTCLLIAVVSLWSRGHQYFPIIFH